MPIEWPNIVSLIHLFYLSMLYYFWLQITWITKFVSKIAAIDKLEYIDWMYQTESMLAS
jgi:hypothetical protein